MTVHKPVLLREALEIFNPQPGQVYIDGTINGGGHASAIAERIGEDGRLLGIDWDCGLIERLERKDQEDGIRNRTLVCANYADMAAIAEDAGVSEANGVLLDLGFSSYHTDVSGRGFSFLKDEPLDMRYCAETGHETAADIVNTRSQKELEQIFRAYGEERFARRIARGIADARKKRPIIRTFELVELIKKNVGQPFRAGRVHPATRVFQGLRIAVNHELDNLRRGLDGAIPLLAKGGILAVISFHSLEDRIVKQFFRESEKRGGYYSPTKKPIVASDQEIKDNPRSRSAKLRVLCNI